MSRPNTKSKLSSGNTLTAVASSGHDSDSDFNGGIYKYEKKKRTRKSRPKDHSEPAISRLKAGFSKYSPLAEFFEEDTFEIDDDLASSHPMTSSKESEELEEDVSSGEQSTSDGSVEDETRKQLKRSAADAFGKLTDENSVTESESDAEPQILMSKNSFKRNIKNMSAFKRVGTLNIDSRDSVTESDSEYERIAKTVVNKRKISISVVLGDGSSTEPEDDAEVQPDELLCSKPAMAKEVGRKQLPPLVLDGTKGIIVPALINTLLREYQREGVHFLYERYKSGLGALLGDDMGLGKTIQIISFLSAIMLKHGDTRDVGRRHRRVTELQERAEWREHRRLPAANDKWPTCLIIAPSSVVWNWQREFEKWGYFDVGMYIGPPKERESVLKNFNLGRLDIVLTSFDTARGDIGILHDLSWTVVIVDEVHHVKNPEAKLTQALGQFLCKQRIGLTGTAIQNSYSELWTILNWTNPGRLGTFDEWSSFVMLPLSVGQSSRASDEQRSRARLVSLALRDKLLPRYFLRRTKDIIQDQMPTKIDQIVFCPLTQNQTEVYKRILKLPAVYNMVHKEDICDCGSGIKRKKCCYPWAKEDLFKYLSTLIKISNHLALILPSPEDTPEQIGRNRELVELVLPKEQNMKYSQAMLQPELCGKWLVLETLLLEWGKDRSNKVLIFTKSVKLLNMLDFHLSKEGCGFVRLDGTTKQSERMPLIDKFHQDPDIKVFLVSTLAGGTGLNFTGANKVVIFDPNWNPAHDLQAMDRAYRLGQTRDVEVYRLLGAGSIEELVYARQVYKQQQMKIGYEASVQTRYFSGVQRVEGMQGDLFGLKNIFTLHEDTLATKMAIERAHISELDWALEHYTSEKRKGANWVYEAEKRNNESDLGGLAALLLDDEVTPTTAVVKNKLDHALKAQGIRYSHHNDAVLATNPAEEKRTKKILQAHKKQRPSMPRSSSSISSSTKTQGEALSAIDTEWPPIRKHHGPPPSSKNRLNARRNALVELGFLREADDLGRFAGMFARKSHEDQGAILARLDDHARKADRL